MAIKNSHSLALPHSLRLCIQTLFNIAHTQRRPSTSLLIDFARRMLTSSHVELEFVRLFGPASVNPFNGLLSVFYGQHSQPCGPPRRRRSGSGSEPRSQLEFTIISSFDVAARFQRTFYALSHICIVWQKTRGGRTRRKHRERERDGFLLCLPFLKFVNWPF